MAKLDLPIHSRQGLFVLVCIWILFYFLFFAKVNNEIVQFDMQNKVEACFGTQSVPWV